MDEQINIQSQIIKFFQILLRRWPVIWIVVAMVVGPVGYYSYFVAKPRYRAEATVVYEENQPLVAERTYTPYSLRENIIQNFIKEVDSYSLMNEVVHSLSDTVRQILIGDNPIPSGYDEYEFLTYFLLKNIKAKAVPKSDNIIIEAYASHNTSAAIMANKTAEKLRERNLNEVNKETQLIEKELVSVKRKVDEYARAIKEYKEKNEIILISQLSEEIYRRVTEAEVIHNETITSLESSKEALEFVQEKLARSRSDLVPSITQVTNRWAQELTNKLVELQNQKTALEVQGYSESHSMMVQLENQIQEAKRKLEEETLKIASGENTIDPLSQIQRDLEEIARLEVEIHTLTAKAQGLRKILDDYNRMLQEIPKKEMELENLEREKRTAEELYARLSQQLAEARIQAENEANIRITDPARIPKSTVSPRKKLYLVVGLFMGLILSVVVVLIWEIFDFRIKSADDIASHIYLPVMGSIPKVKAVSTDKYEIQGELPDKKRIEAPDLIFLHHTNLPVIEAFRILRTSIHAENTHADEAKSILITSANPSEGKSFIAANLAASISQLGNRVLLLDADLRKPVLHNTFQVPIKPGLIEILTVISRDSRIQPEYYKKDKPKKNIRKRSIGNLISQVVKKTQYNNLFILPCGHVPIKNPSEMLSSECMQYFLTNVRKYFDIMILDMPPVNLVTDAVIMAQKTDEILFVIGAGVSKVHEINRAKDLLQQGSKKGIQGVILNLADWFSGYYHGYYYGQKKQNLLRFNLDKMTHKQARVK